LSAKKERPEVDEVEEKPTTHPSQRFCGMSSPTAMVALLVAVAAGVTVFALTRGPARVTASGADAFFEEDRSGPTAAVFAPWPHAIPLIGKHWIVEAEGCDGATINDEAAMVRIVRGAVAAANASLVTIISKGFDHMGVTILALLSESHIGIHTWPQYGYAATDVFTCGHIAQPQVAVHHLLTEWKCNESMTRYVFMHRGGAIASSDLRTLEENNDNKELIAYVKTPYQKAHIFWTEVSGLHLFLDGTTQTVESDERIYHESLVHPAMLAHPKPRNVVILGGAEGAVLREVLSHSTVEHVSMVEIDGEVVALCREFMPTWSDGAFEDSRANLFIGDAKEYVEGRLTDHSVDVIIMDLVDPMVGVPNNFPAYQLSFFKTLAQRLSGNGVLVLQAGQVDEDDDQGIVPFAKLLHELHAAFAFVSYYTKYIRSSDGFWGFIIACIDPSCNASPIVNPESAPALVDKLISDRVRSKHSLHSFDGESNRGMFSVNRETRAALAALDIQHERSIRHA
jgi:spermidine synthase